MIRVIAAGLFTTVQDEGRWGSQGSGMPVAGTMDRFAFRVANILAGNPPDAAVLEMTLTGDTFKFERESNVAICGADMQATLDGVPVRNWSSFVVTAGSELAFQFARKGCRAYLAVNGGIDVPLFLGSRSTLVRAAVGGLEGRKLRAGDRLKIGGQTFKAAAACVLPEKYRPDYVSPVIVRVLPGPQDDMFTGKGLETFFNCTYAVSNHADRMGYRLEGPRVAHKCGADIVSDGLCQGAVQVPGDGMPIVMMADRQTTGGYPKIGAVIGPDLMWLAQAKPGDEVAFRQCSDEEAVEALRAERESYAKIDRWRQAAAQMDRLSVRKYLVTVNGKTYRVEISEET